MATIGYATLPIIPSMQGISGNLSQLIGAPIVAAGQRAGQDAGRAVGRGMAGGMSASQSTVEAASAKLAAARGKEADAAGKVRVAELKLQELRDKGTATASQIAAAEERLATAERGRDTAVSNRLRAVNDLTQARARAANGADEEADAIDDATEAQERNADGAVDLAKKLGGLAIAAAGIGSAMDLAMQGLDNDMVMDKLAASLGASPALAKEYGESAGRLYRSGLGESMDDVATAIASVQTSFKTLGFEGEVSMDKAAERAMNFANTFDQDVSASVQSAAQLVKNGLAKDSTEAFDLMTAAAQRVGPAMRDELPELMNEYGTFFSSMGFSGQEAFGLLVNASEQGAIAMDKVGDALKESTIAATEIDNQAVIDTFTSMKMNAGEMSRALLAGGDTAKVAFGQMVDGLMAIEDPGEQATAALNLFGAPLEDLNKSEIPAFLQSMSGAGESMAGFEGSADQMGATLNDNLGSKIESIKRTVQGFASDAIMNLINGFVNLGTGATNLWNSLGPVNEIFSQAKDTVSLFIGTLTGEGADVDLPWMNTVIDLGTRVRGAFDEVTGGFTAFKNAFVDGGDEVTSSGFAGFLEQLGIYARDIADTFNATVMPAIRTFGDIAMDVGSVALPLIFDAIVLVKDVLVTLGEGIFAVVNFFKEHKDVAIALAGILAASLLPTLITMGITLATQAGLWIAQTAAVGGYVLIQGAANTATKIWAAGQWLLNAALNANPIGIVIGVIAALVAGIVLAYRNSETFRNIVQAAWQGIQAAIDFAWNNVIKPVWDALLFALGKMGEFFTWVWNSVIKPAWDGLAAGISWAWENIIRPAWDGLQAGLSAVGDLFRSVWENVIKPAWDGLGAGISWVWENVIKKAWDGLKEGLETVKNSFSTAVDFIGKVWDGIKGIVAKPVKFVVETVYNNGIRGAWNKVAGWLNLPELPEAQLGELGNYAKGTAVLPGYSPGVDNMRFVSTDGSTAINLGGGEGIVRPEVTKALGPGWINSVNASASNGGVQGVKKFLGGYASGGTIANGAELTSGIQNSMWDAVRTAFPNAILTSGTRYADVGSGFDNHMGQTAIDLAGPMSQMARWIYELNNTQPVEELIHAPLDGWQNLKAGAPLNYGASTDADHYDHVHWAMRQMVDSDGKLVSSDSGGGGFFGAIKNWLRNRVADAFDKVIDPIGNAIPTFGDSMIGQLPKTVFGYMKDKVRDWLLGKADEQDTSSGGNAVPGSGPTADQVKAAFAPYGWDSGDQWAAADWIIGKESGWDPEAVNPSSGAYGLFQFLGSTKDQYLPDMNPNPGIQGAAGARYIKDRYGDPLAAKRFWEANGWYDDGGLATGVGYMAKNVLAPERVLSPSETKAWEMLVPHLVSLVPALEHFESVVTSPAFTSAQSLLADGEFTPGFRESFGVEESSPIVNAVLGVRDQLKGIVPDLFGTTGAAAGEATGEVDSLGAVEPGMETGPTEPIGGSGVASSYGEGAQGNPEVDKWTEWAQNAGKQWEDYFKDNWKEMLNTAVGVGLGSRGGGGDTFNMNGNSDTQVAKVIQRNQRRKSLAQQRSGGFGRG